MFSVVLSAAAVVSSVASVDFSAASSAVIDGVGVVSGLAFSFVVDACNGLIQETLKCGRTGLS